MKTVIPIDIVTLGDDNSFHIFISGIVDGNQCELLIDTGASFTIFDSRMIPEMPDDDNESQRIESASINPGDLKCSIGQINELILGSFKCRDRKIALIDLTHVNEMYKRFTHKRIAGLIGSDFLLEHNAVIDYKKRQLVLQF